MNRALRPGHGGEWYGAPAGLSTGCVAPGRAAKWSSIQADPAVQAPWILPCDRAANVGQHRMAAEGTALTRGLRDCARRTRSIAHLEPPTPAVMPAGA